MTRDDALRVYDDALRVYGDAAERARRAGELADARRASAAAYLDELGEDERAVQAARHELRQLEDARSSAWSQPPAGSGWKPPRGPVVHPPPPEVPSSRALGNDRQALRTLVNRFRVRWKVPRLGEFNRIVDSPQHLLGEAVLLLPRVAFDPTPDEEADEYHARLRAWSDALTEYVEHLLRQGVEAGAGDLDGVLELWLSRPADGGRGWVAFIAARRASLRGELESLRRQIAARPRTTGGAA